MIEIGFIVFLFYSNLLMGEFTRVNRRGKSSYREMGPVFDGSLLWEPSRPIAAATAVIILNSLRSDTIWFSIDFSLNTWLL